MPWQACAAEVLDWLEQAYPEEGCGLLVEAKGTFRFIACDNLAERYGRDPASGYVIDPLEFVWAEDRGESVVAVVHSHPDSPDWFSDEDVADALVPGAGVTAAQPSFPGVFYLVVSVRQGRACGASMYEFDGDQPRGFRRVGQWTLGEPKVS